MALAHLMWTPADHPAIDVLFVKVTEPFGTIPVGTYAVPSCCGTAVERRAVFGRLDRLQGDGPVRSLVHVKPSDLVGFLRMAQYKGNTNDMLRASRKGEPTAILLTAAIRGQGMRFMDFPWPTSCDAFQIAPAVPGASVAHAVPPAVRARAHTLLVCVW